MTEGELVRMVACGHITRTPGRKGQLGATTKGMVTCKVCGKISFAVWVSLQEWWASDQYKQLVQAPPAVTKGTGLQREGAPVR
jgi:hypothetical protein